MPVTSNIGGRIAKYNLLETISCGKCGIYFALPEEFLNGRRNDGQIFYCPNGHGRIYRTTEADRLREELHRTKKMAETMEQRANKYIAENAALHRSRSAVQGQVTKLKRRSANGVCPCCNRTFSQLSNHIADKHPDYLKDANSVK